SMVALSLLEFFVREDMNKTVQRAMAVIDPVKVIIDNYPEEKVEMIEADNNPEDEGAGTRELPFSRVIFIEREDFMEDPPKKFFRLAPGREVRLKHAYFIRCGQVVKDAAGAVTEIHCTYDPASRGGRSPDGRKVRGALHWLSAAHAPDAELRLYEPLFTCENPAALPGDADFPAAINPRSLRVVTGKIEPALAGAACGEKFQFLRQGYFCADSDHRPERPVFNRTVSLKDGWARVQRNS
ncbi:MAG: glutamine--tRNA ligase, partial [Salinispira sp.]